MGIRVFFVVLKEVTAIGNPPHIPTQWKDPMSPAAKTSGYSIILLIKDTIWKKGMFYFIVPGIDIWIQCSIL